MKFDLNTFIRGATKVILPGGIVGKTSYVLIAVCAALAVIAGAIRTEPIGYAAIGALAVIVLPTIWRLIRFAERHPERALMEGGEYLAYVHLAQKGRGEFAPSPEELPTAEATQLLPEITEAAQRPDPLLIDQPKPKRTRRNG